MKDWTGSLGINRRNDFYHLSYQGTSGAAGFIDLDINHKATQGTTTDPVTGKTTTTLTFANAKAFIGATSTPDGSTIDSDDRCVTFHVTATK